MSIERENGKVCNALLQTSLYTFRKHQDLSIQNGDYAAKSVLYVRVLNVKRLEDHEFLTKRGMQLDKDSCVFPKSQLAEHAVNLVANCMDFFSKASAI